MKRVAIVIALMSTLAGPAFAQSWGPQFSNHWNINNIKMALQNRIRVGAQNGSLDRREVDKLQDEYDRISDLERKLRRDGLTLDERMRLDRELDKLSADIYRESRDGNYLGSTPWGWVNTPSWRPNGWDDRRWSSTNWDNRFNDNGWSNNPSNNWWNNNRWNNQSSNNPSNNWWNSNHWNNQSSNNPSNNNNWWNNRANNNEYNQVERNLSDRIRKGNRDGSLTADESNRLKDRLRDLKREESRMASNGLTPSERSQLSQKFNQLSRQVRRERHD